jgi:hypothetical protein
MCAASHRASDYICKCPVQFWFALLELVMKAEGGGDIVAHRCRLCPNGGNAFAWKKPMDALRYLKRDHFGLGHRCPNWWVCPPEMRTEDSRWTHSGKTVYTNGEMKSHRCRATVPKARGSSMIERYPKLCTSVELHNVDFRN